MRRHAWRACQTVLRRNQTSVGLPTTNAVAGSAQQLLQSASSTLSNNMHFSRGLATEFDTPGTPPAGAYQPPGSLEVNSPQTFSQAVAASSSQPVLIFVYSPALPACQEMARKLASVTSALQRKLHIAQINVDNPSVAPLLGQLGVQALPTVFLLHNARILGAREDNPPAKELMSWLAANLSDVAQPAAEQAPTLNVPELLSRGMAALQDATQGPQAAAAPFAEVLAPGSGASPPQKAAALAGLARAALLDSPPDIDTAQGLIANAKQTMGKEPLPWEVTAGEAWIGLAAGAHDAAAVQAPDAATQSGSREGLSLSGQSMEELQQLVAANPRDPEALRALAQRQFLSREPEAALNTALVLVRKHRAWNDEAGRKLVVQMLDALGPEDALAKKSRQQLNNIWFL